MNIKKLLQAGEVVRYHNHSGIDKQTLAQHQWGVAMIVKKICPDASANLLMAALTHDCAEYHTGDLPAPVKWSNPDLKISLDTMEEEWLYEQGALFHLTGPEAAILTLADKFEGMWFCIQQMKNGHQAARRPFRLWAKAVEGLLDHHMPAQVNAMFNLLLTEKEKWDVSK